MASKQPVKVLVIGGGLSGLTFVYTLQRELRKRGRKNIHITLVDKNKKPGGWVDTIHAPYTLELGPRAISLKKSKGLASREDHLRTLVLSLGLASEMVDAAPSAGKRYIFNGRELINAASFKLKDPIMKNILSGIAQFALKTRKSLFDINCQVYGDPLVYNMQRDAQVFGYDVDNVGAAVNPMHNVPQALIVDEKASNTVPVRASTSNEIKTEQTSADNVSSAVTSSPAPHSIATLLVKFVDTSIAGPTGIVHLNTIVYPDDATRSIEELKKLKGGNSENPDSDVSGILSVPRWMREYVDERVKSHNPELHKENTSSDNVNTPQNAVAISRILIGKHGLMKDIIQTSFRITYRATRQRSIEDNYLVKDGNTNTDTSTTSNTTNPCSTTSNSTSSAATTSNPTSSATTPSAATPLSKSILTAPDGRRIDLSKMSESKIKELLGLPAELNLEEVEVTQDAALDKAAVERQTAKEREVKAREGMGVGKGSVFVKGDVSHLHAAKAEAYALSSHPVFGYSYAHSVHAKDQYDIARDVDTLTDKHVVVMKSPVSSAYYGRVLVRPRSDVMEVAWESVNAGNKQTSGIPGLLNRLQKTVGKYIEKEYNKANNITALSNNDDNAKIDEDEENSVMPPPYEVLNEFGYPDESIREYFSRNVNAHFTDSLLDPLVAGIYGGNIRKLSMTSAFPDIVEKEVEKSQLRRRTKSRHNEISFMRHVVETGRYVLGAMVINKEAFQKQMAQARAAAQTTAGTVMKNSTSNGAPSAVAADAGTSTGDAKATTSIGILDYLVNRVQDWKTMKKSSKVRFFSFRDVLSHKTATIPKKPNIMDKKLHKRSSAPIQRILGTPPHPYYGPAALAYVMHDGSAMRQFQNWVMKRRNPLFTFKGGMCVLPRTMLNKILQNKKMLRDGATATVHRGMYMLNKLDMEECGEVTTVVMKNSEVLYMQSNVDDDTIAFETQQMEIREKEAKNGGGVSEEPEKEVIEAEILRDGEEINVLDDEYIYSKDDISNEKLQYNPQYATEIEKSTKQKEIDAKKHEKQEQLRQLREKQREEADLRILRNRRIKVGIRSYVDDNIPETNDDKIDNAKTSSENAPTGQSVTTDTEDVSKIKRVKKGALTNADMSVLIGDGDNAQSSSFTHLQKEKKANVVDTVDEFDYIFSTLNTKQLATILSHPESYGNRVSEVYDYGFNKYAHATLKDQLQFSRLLMDENKDVIEKIKSDKPSTNHGSRETTIIHGNGTLTTLPKSIFTAQERKMIQHALPSAVIDDFEHEDIIRIDYGCNRVKMTEEQLKQEQDALLQNNGVQSTKTHHNLTPLCDRVLEVVKMIRASNDAFIEDEVLMQRAKRQLEEKLQEEAYLREQNSRLAKKPASDAADIDDDGFLDVFTTSSSNTNTSSSSQGSPSLKGGAAVRARVLKETYVPKVEYAVSNVLVNPDSYDYHGKLHRSVEKYGGVNEENHASVNVTATIDHTAMNTDASSSSSAVPSPAASASASAEANIAYSRRYVSSIARALNSITHASMWVVNIVYDGAALKHIPKDRKDGFGFLVPTHVTANVNGPESPKRSLKDRREHPLYGLLGVCFDSDVFPDLHVEHSFNKRATLGKNGNSEKFAEKSVTVATNTVRSTDDLLDIVNHPQYKSTVTGKLIRQDLYQYNPLIITVMLGGDRFPDMIYKTHKEIEEITLNMVQHTMNIAHPPTYMRVGIQHECIPQAFIGHNAVVRSIYADINAAYGYVVRPESGIHAPVYNDQNYDMYANRYDEAIGARHPRVKFMGTSAGNPAVKNVCSDAMVAAVNFTRHIDL